MHRKLMFLSAIVTIVLLTLSSVMIVGAAPVSQEPEPTPAPTGNPPGCEHRVKEAAEWVCTWNDTSYDEPFEYDATFHEAVFHYECAEGELDGDQCIIQGDWVDTSHWGPWGDWEDGKCPRNAPEGSCEERYCGFSMNTEVLCSIVPGGHKCEHRTREWIESGYYETETVPADKVIDEEAYYSCDNGGELDGDVCKGVIHHEQGTYTCGWTQPVCGSGGGGEPESQPATGSDAPAPVSPIVYGIPFIVVAGGALAFAARRRHGK